MPLILRIQTAVCSYNKKYIFRILLFQILVGIPKGLKIMKCFQIRCLLFAIGWFMFFKRFAKRFQGFQTFVYVFWFFEYVRFNTIARSWQWSMIEYCRIFQHFSCEMFLGITGALTIPFSMTLNKKVFH